MSLLGSKPLYKGLRRKGKQKPFFSQRESFYRGDMNLE